MCEGYNSVQSGTETDKNYLAEAKFLKPHQPVQ